MVIKTAIAALASCVIVIAGHYFPWRSVLQRELPRTGSYLIGLTAVLVPYTVLLTTYPGWISIEIIGAIWAIALVALITVYVLQLIDGYLEQRARAREAEERERMTLGE